MASSPDRPDPHEIDLAPDEVRAALDAALAVGISELDAGAGIETTPEALLSSIDAELGMRRYDVE